MRKVVKGEKPGDCWKWTGGLRQGYGSMRVKFESIGVHRISYELFVGQIPKGLFVCHKCDTPNCVNPAHLFVGTAADNNRDKANKGRASRFPGEAHPSARLNESDVLQIRSSGQSVGALAKRFGVSHQTISDVKSRRTWAHVD